VRSKFTAGETLLNLVRTHRPQVCVELGSWCGASAIAIANVIREWNGVIICVDTWTGEAAGWGTRAGVPVMLAECAANVVEAGVAPSVRFLVSRTADAIWVGSIDFLFVDADHEYVSVKQDLAVWWPRLRSGGLLAGDDYGHPRYRGLTRAWDEFEVEQKISCHRDATPCGTLIWTVKP